MKINKINAPYIKYPESNRTLMGDIIVAMIPLYIMAYYYYGIRALILGITSILSSVIFDAICVKMRRKKINIRDLSPIVTGMIIPLMMPANIPFYVIITASFVAIAVAKHPFGGTGNNIFNPAATGYAFAALCWTKRMFSYPIPLEHISITEDIIVKTAQSPAYILMQGVVPNNDWLDMLLGNFPGPMGATHILVLFACMLFLIYRKTINWQTPIVFLSSCAVIGFIFPRILTGNPFQSMFLEIFSGFLIFTSIFILPEPVTSPKRMTAKIIYAIIGAIIAMIYRHFGGLEEGVLFAILILNALSPVTDRLGEKIIKSTRRNIIEKV